MKGKLGQLLAGVCVLCLSALFLCRCEPRLPVQHLRAPLPTRRAEPFPMPKSPLGIPPRVYPLTPQPMLRAHLTS